MFPSFPSIRGVANLLGLLALSLALLLLESADGAILFQDSFDYPAGANLRDQISPSGERWEFVGGTTAIAVAPSIGSGSLNYPGFPPSLGNSLIASNDFSGSGRVALGQTITGGTLFYSLLFQVSDITGLSNALTGSFFAGLNTLTGPGTGPAVAAAGMLVRLDPDNSGAYNVGTTLTAATGESRVFDDTEHFEGETLLLIAAYTFNPGAGNDVARLYVNPDLNAFATGVLPTPSAEATGNDVTTGSLVSVFLRNNTLEAQQMFMDELRVGTAPLDVVPEPSAALLLGMMVGLVGAIRRVRATTSRTHRA